MSIVGEFGKIEYMIITSGRLSSAACFGYVCILFTLFIALKNFFNISEGFIVEVICGDIFICAIECYWNIFVMGIVQKIFYKCLLLRFFYSKDQYLSKISDSRSLTICSYLVFRKFTYL